MMSDRATEKRQGLIAAALSVRRLEPTAKLLLIEMASRADERGLCAVTIGALAKAINVDRATTQAALVTLRVARHVTLGAFPGVLAMALVQPQTGAERNG